MSLKTIACTDRLTFLDAVQYEATSTPGVGNYNTRPHSAGALSKSKMKPDDWRKRHRAESQRKILKAPDMGTYSPYVTLRKNTNKKMKHTWGNVDRFKIGSQIGRNLGPGEYVKLDEWIKDNLHTKKK
eukprot:GHVR01087789.1.p1 GENE.GHVR01087789.1~~GHVR01087789.1.p1  ORF type:complete len:128 (+),score=6.18 GHVR01087789.1:609-992(+)